MRMRTEEKHWPVVRVGPVDPVLLRDQVKWLEEQVGCAEQSGLLNLMKHILDLCDEARR